MKIVLKHWFDNPPDLAGKLPISALIALSSDKANNLSISSELQKNVILPNFVEKPSSFDFAYCCVYVIIFQFS